MKIDKLLFEHFAELRLRGEFDTFYCPKLMEEVDNLISAGTLYAMLNLRLVKFINSTALGAIIKSHKRFKAEGGELVIVEPSRFCKDVLTKVGVDRIVPLFENHDEAQAFLMDHMKSCGEAQVIGESNVLFTFPDPARAKELGTQKTGLGTVLAVDHEGIRFSWNHLASTSDLEALFPVDAEIHAKFQVKLCKKGFFEIPSRITSRNAEAVEDGNRITIRAAFLALSETDRLALAQFADDLDYLKQQLKGV